MSSLTCKSNVAQGYNPNNESATSYILPVSPMGDLSSYRSEYELLDRSTTTTTTTTSPTISESTTNDSSDSTWPPISSIKIKCSPGRHFLLQFRTSSARFEFLRRPTEPINPTDKASQVQSRPFIAECRGLNRSQQPCLVRCQRFRLASSTKTSPPPTLADPCKKEQQCGDNEEEEEEEEQSDGRIYVRKDGILFCLTVQHPCLDSIKPLLLINDQSKLLIASDDRASLLVTINNRLARIDFLMRDISILPIHNRRLSRGIQSTDRCAYFKMTPQGRTKPVYCPIPLSTYIYQGPCQPGKRTNGLAGRGPYLVKNRLMGDSHRARRASLKRRQVSSSASSSDTAFNFKGHNLVLKIGCGKGWIVEGEELFPDFFNRH